VWSARLGHASKALVAREALAWKSKAMERELTRDAEMNSYAPDAKEVQRGRWGVWSLRRTAAATECSIYGGTLVAIASARSVTMHVRTRIKYKSGFPTGTTVGISPQWGLKLTNQRGDI
jgi:hypothetical protein